MPGDEGVQGEAERRQLAPLLLDSLDYVWSRLRERLSGLGEREYLWEPVPGCWSVRQAAGGGWEIDRADPEPSPPPVTTIAWRLWHIGSECLAGYTEGGLGSWPLRVRGRQWYPAPGPALAAADRAWEAFRAGLAGLGEEGLWRPLGPAWGQWSESPWAHLVLHAQDELSHHGAEVGLLRDLYLREQALGAGPTLHRGPPAPCPAGPRRGSAAATGA